MTDTRPRYPVRDPAPGPAVILDLPKLWAAVTAQMDVRGMTTMKQLSEMTGLDRNTLGRTKARAEGRFCRHGAAVVWGKAHQEEENSEAEPTYRWEHHVPGSDDDRTPCDDPDPHVGQIVHGQRGGLNVNAFLTLVTFAHAHRADYGQWTRTAADLLGPLSGHRDDSADVTVAPETVRTTTDTE